MNARVVEWQIKVQAETQSKAEFQHFNKLLRDLGAGMDKMKSQQEEVQLSHRHMCRVHGSGIHPDIR